MGKIVTQGSCHTIFHWGYACMQIGCIHPSQNINPPCLSLSLSRFSQLRLYSHRHAVPTFHPLPSLFPFSVHPRYHEDAPRINADRADLYLAKVLTASSLLSRLIYTTIQAFSRRTCVPGFSECTLYYCDTTSACAHVHRVFRKSLNFIC